MWAALRGGRGRGGAGSTEPAATRKDDALVELARAALKDYVRVVAWLARANRYVPEDVEANCCLTAVSHDVRRHTVVRGPPRKSLCWGGRPHAEIGPERSLQAEGWERAEGPQIPPVGPRVGEVGPPRGVVRPTSRRLEQRSATRRPEAARGPRRSKLAKIPVCGVRRAAASVAASPSLSDVSPGEQSAPRSRGTLARRGAE